MSLPTNVSEANVCQKGCISPSVMLPENRLAVLLQQVKQSQIDTCLYHTAASSPSLYSDHLCDRRNFPTEVALELSELAGEVWQVQFSHDGTRLAGCGSGRDVIIWDTKTFAVISALTDHDKGTAGAPTDHEKGVGQVSWSPDDNMIVTCARDKQARLWDTKVCIVREEMPKDKIRLTVLQSGTLLKKYRKFEEPVIACAWASDGQSFTLGTLDRNFGVCTFDISGDDSIPWSMKHRVQDMCASPDGRWLVTADNDQTLHVYNALTRELEYELALGCRPVSVAISQDSRHLLVNKQDSEAQLIDLVTKNTVQKFLGHKVGDYIIRASFGGANESFVVSGSDDGNMFIWHKNIGAAVERLPGHAKRCNGAAWNPADPCMLASCSDEGPIKM